MKQLFLIKIDLLICEYKIGNSSTKLKGKLGFGLARSPIDLVGTRTSHKDPISLLHNDITWIFILGEWSPFIENTQDTIETTCLLKSKKYYATCNKNNRIPISL